MLGILPATLEEETHKAKHKVYFEFIPTRIIIYFGYYLASLASTSSVLKNAKTLTLFWLIF